DEPHAERRQTWLLAVSGALSLATWFGKPTYALFTFAQVAALIVDDGLVLPRRAALRAFAIGGAAAVAVAALLLCAFGDVHAFVHLQLVDVPAMYRFIWPRAPADVFSEPWRATQAIFGIVGTVTMLGLVAIGEMPRRALALALVPVCALGGVIVQAKGFPYHFHPVCAGVHMQWLALAAWVAERTRAPGRRWPIVRAVPIAVGAVIALRVATAMEDSPYIRATWLLWGARTPAERSTPEYFAHFKRPDFFAYELRETARYLQAHTTPSDRVQTYGMDPYVLFLARRLSATPYIYAYDLNADAALEGGTGGIPDEAEAKTIRAIRDAHEDDLFARIKARPPAAFVFMDGVPLLSREDAWEDFEDHCTKAAPWVEAHYREAATFGHDHVWLRN
ncbi:MAG: hypothetical protein ACREJ3_14405, partial [Polyangiaceae bacterium]